MSTSKPKVLIWGIAGASLGMEIAKSLAKGGGFDVRGADISPQAFGHFADCFSKSYVLNRDTCESDACKILATMSPPAIRKSMFSSARILHASLSHVSLLST